MLWITWAWGAEGGAGLFVEAGAEAVMNDPFHQVAGLQVGAGVAWLPWLRTGVAGGVYPDLGSTSYKPVTRQIIEQNNVVPDLSPILARGLLRATVLPVRVESDGLTGTVGAEIGVGAVFTRDDLELLDKEDDPDALAVERQWHAATSFGAVGELRGRVHGLTLRVERTSYVETVEDVDEHKRPIWVNVMWTWRP